MKFSNKELAKVTELDLDLEVEKSKIQNHELQVQNLMLRQKVLGHEIQEAQVRLSTQKNLINAKLESKREYLKRIAKKYKLKEGWGFNPDTGEIKDGGDE